MKKRLCLIVIFAAAAIAAQVALYAHRPVKVPAMAESAFAAFGGLRSIAAEVTWFRADRLQEEGRYAELAQLAHTLTLAEPHVPEVWSYAAWNLAYNISIMMATPDDRWRWVHAGLALLRDQGLEYNPTSFELHRELAWMFELKIGADIDSAAETYRTKWREIVGDVEKRDAWEELKMDRAFMSKMERDMRIYDRADPQYSAIYWASRGLLYAHKKLDREILKEIIRQANIIYSRSHSGVATNG